MICIFIEAVSTTCKATKKMEARIKGEEEKCKRKQRKIQKIDRVSI